MRRGITFSKKAYVFLAITAFFNLLAISFDQLVIQQEDKIRIYDNKINESRLAVKSFLYSHNVMDELWVKVHFNASSLMGNLNYQSRVIDFLNSDLAKQIDENKIQNIIETYSYKLKLLLPKFQTEKNETKQILEKISNNDGFKNFIKKNNYANKSFARIKNELNQTVKLDLLDHYNFEAKSEKEQSENYKVYGKFYDHLLRYNRLKNDLISISGEFKIEFNRAFTNYYVLLDEFTLEKNNKNFLILLSILFQILGLVFLVILFRILIQENK